MCEGEIRKEKAADKLNSGLECRRLQRMRRAKPMPPTVQETIATEHDELWAAGVLLLTHFNRLTFKHKPKLPRLKLSRRGSIVVNLPTECGARQLNHLWCC